MSESKFGDCLWGVDTDMTNCYENIQDLKMLKIELFSACGQLHSSGPLNLQHPF